MLTLPETTMIVPPWMPYAIWNMISGDTQVRIAVFLKDGVSTKRTSTFATMFGIGWKTSESRADRAHPSHQGCKSQLPEFRACCYEVHVLNMCHSWLIKRPRVWILKTYPVCYIHQHASVPGVVSVGQCSDMTMYSSSWWWVRNWRYGGTNLSCNLGLGQDMPLVWHHHAGTAWRSIFFSDSDFFISLFLTWRWVFKMRADGRALTDDC